MTRLCMQFNCLPGAGGLLDQDSKYIWMMGLVADADAERAKLESQRSGKP